MFAQTSSIADPTPELAVSDDTRDARDPLSLEHATSVRLLLTVSATLIVTAAIVAASFVVYKADGSQLDTHNLAHLRLLLMLISAASIGAAAALAALVSSRAVAPLRRLAVSIERILEQETQPADMGTAAGAKKVTSRRGSTSCLPTPKSRRVDRQTCF